MQNTETITTSLVAETSVATIPTSDSDDETESKNTPEELVLLEAAAAGNLEKVTALIGQGINIDCQDNWGWTPLMMAASWAKDEVVQLLVDNRASLCMVSEVDGVVLEIAVGVSRKNALSTIEILMKALRGNAEAWTSYESRWGLAVMKAFKAGQAAYLQALLSHLDAYAKELKDEDEKLQFKEFYLQYFSDHIMTIPLMDAAAAVSIDSPDFLKPSCVSGNKECLKLLLAVGTPLDARNMQGQTALDVAKAVIIPDDHPAKESLIMMKQNTIAVLESAEKLMSLCRGTLTAVPGESLPTVASLFEKGASLTQEDAQGRTVLGLTIESRNLELVKDIFKLTKKMIFVADAEKCFLVGCIVENQDPNSWEIYVRYNYQDLMLMVEKAIFNKDIFETYLKKIVLPERLEQKNKICVALGKILKYDCVFLQPAHRAMFEFYSMDFFKKVTQPTTVDSPFAMARHEIADMLAMGANSGSSLVEQASDVKESLDVTSTQDDLPVAVQRNVDPKELALLYALEGRDSSQPAASLRMQLANNFAGFPPGYACGDLAEPRYVVALFKENISLRKDAASLHAELKTLREEATLMRARLTQVESQTAIQVEPRPVINQFRISRKRHNRDINVAGDEQPEKALKT